jgi:hypothetical protein
MPTNTSKAKLFKAASASFVIILFLLLSLLSFSTPAYSHADDNAQYFPETKHNLSGKFLQY